MARINLDDVEAVRGRTDIVALIGQHVALKRAGQSFSGLCPFHTEKTASFNVNPDKGLYYCYGCGKGGNCFHFVMEVEGLSFPEAVERLAGPAGVTLRYEGGSKARHTASRRDALLRANARANDLYHQMLLSGREGEDARQYLESRGITGESIEAFTVGYAPRYPDFLLRRIAKDFSPEILEEAGLAIKDASRGVRDYFRGRVTFPVDDLAGRTVGFGARLLDGEGPKYLNTKATPVYDKGSMLYNLHRARQAIGQSERAFVVEGYTDVIALAQSGVLEAVATCGTAVGEGHFTLLSRFARKVVLAFDSDEAGARAAERAYALFERFPLEVMVLVLPEGLDPADMVREHGPEEFVAHAEKAVPLVEFMLRRAIRGHDHDTPEGRARAVQAGLPVVLGLDDPVRRDQYAGMLSDVTGASSSSVLEALERHAPSSQGRPVARREAAPIRSGARDVEREALKLLAQHAALCAPYMEGLPEDAFETERDRRLFVLLVAAAGNPASVLERANEENLGQWLSQVTVEPLTGTATSEYAESVFARLEELYLGRRITTVRKRLERLNPTTQPEEYDALFEKLISLESERRRARARAGEGA